MNEIIKISNRIVARIDRHRFIDCLFPYRNVKYDVKKVKLIIRQDYTNDFTINDGTSRWIVKIIIDFHRSSFLFYRNNI